MVLLSLRLVGAIGARIVARSCNDQIRTKALTVINPVLYH